VPHENPTGQNHESFDDIDKEWSELQGNEAQAIERSRKELKELLLPFSDALDEMPASNPDKKLLREITTALGTLLNPDGLQSRSSRMLVARQALAEAHAAAKRTFEELHTAEERTS